MTAPRLPYVRAGALVAAGTLLVGTAGGYVLAGGASTSLSKDTSALATSTQEANLPAPPTQDESTAAPLDGASSVFFNSHEFYGDHQAGVETPPPLLQSFVGFDLAARNPSTAQAVLLLLSDDAARLMAGEPALGDLEPEIAKRPAGLTITVGLGRGFYDAAGAPAPEVLRDIPAFPTDDLDPRWGQTDFVVQVGSHDPLSLSHAVRMLGKDLKSLAAPVWVQDGFRSGADVAENYDVPRNLLGQVDGIVNPVPGSDQFGRVVWVDSPDPTQDGGTVLVLRRVKLLTNEWDHLDPSAQNQVMGRERDSGAPLGGNPGDEMPFDEVAPDGLPVIDANAHARVTHAESEEGMIFRRPYNYDAGIDRADDGDVMDVGLLFAAYMRDPATSFIPMQTALAKLDAFNKWNTHVGSATYFVLPGAAEGETLGQGLFP